MSTAWNKAEWSNWLIKSFRNYYDTDAGRFAFDPYHTYSELDVTPGADLSNLSFRMGWWNCASFQNGVLAAVSELHIVQDIRPIKDLVDVVCSHCILGAHEILFTKVKEMLVEGIGQSLTEEHLDFLKLTFIAEGGTQYSLPLNNYIGARLLELPQL